VKTEKEEFPLPLSPVEINAPVADVVEEFFRWLPWEDVTAPFQGALDEWPQRLTEGLQVARREWHALVTWQQWRRAKRM